MSLSPGCWVWWRGRLPGFPLRVVRVYRLLRPLGDGRWLAVRMGEQGVIRPFVGPGWSLTCR